MTDADAGGDSEQADVAAVLSSYARCREHGSFVEEFYRQLLSRDASIARRFEHTDMERQQQIMRDAINTLLMFARGSAMARMALERIAAVHGRHRHDVPPSLYSLFTEVLVATAAAADPAWSPTLERQWRATLGPGLELMASRY